MSKYNLKAYFNRLIMVGALALLQAVFLVVAIWKFSNVFVYIYSALTLISLAVVIYIINRPDNPSFKLAWVVPILLFPVFGGFTYLLCNFQSTSKKVKRELRKMFEQSLPYLAQDPKIVEELRTKENYSANQTDYLIEHAGYPIYRNTTVEYLSPGEVKFERLLEELRKAEHYIFMEYFIIQEGIMWNSILDVLEEKAKAGVDVRVMYDDMGSITTLPGKYDRVLESRGIHCKVFNRFVPFLTTIQNNRDHRKIVVIDGHTAFTGGINLADEYINAYPKHGHWKDASIVLKGDAVFSFTVMFLRMWNLREELPEDMEEYRPHRYHPENFPSDGYVQPYGDDPMDNEHVGEMVYLDIINKAKKYVYIASPYLIVGSELMTALELAAKNGVDVRIITPHIADKWYVHIETRSSYQELIEAGVKIYEYTPGFIHSKTFVSDDEVAVVGTVNMDFRSLYFHFECAALLYKNQAVGEVLEDYLKTLKVCQPVSLEECKKIPAIKRLAGGVLRLFAPLM